MIIAPIICVPLLFCGLPWLSPSLSVFVAIIAIYIKATTTITTTTTTTVAGMEKRWEEGREKRRKERQQQCNSFCLLLACKTNQLCHQF